MEAVPKLPMISFELKVSPENTHFGPKLKQYISEAYREDPDSYSNEIHQLEGLRSAAVRPTTDSAGLSALIRYFCQLRAIQSRFPMAKGQPVACTFAWKDIYANMTCPLADIRFEMACILYNIGALHTQLAASEPRTSVESLKTACTRYQNAAWAFQHLREQYPQPPGVDVSSDIMRLFQEICFAQAQECILDKSIQDTKKPSVVGAVATQVLFFYRNALALLGPSTGTDNIHEITGTKIYNYWHRYLSFKSFYVGCIVCLYQGMNAEEQQKMGERVAFYQQAVDKLNEARKLAKYIEPTQITQEALTFTNDVVEGKRKAAKNENEFIYHEEVPDKDLLLDLKPVCLVKAMAINFNDPELSGPDIFSRLVPIGAHEASSMYSEEKAKLLRHVVGQAESKNTELMEFMSSLQLDQLEVLESDQKIPQEIVDRCAAMNAKAEIIQTLVDSMNNLAEIITDVEQSLAEIKTLIQDETKKEKDYQQVMGPRPPSIVQTELSREYHKYQEAHSRTNESNQVLHKAMTLHIANLRLLAQPLDVLQVKIPSIDNIEGLDRETMAEMRRVVGKAREMQTQRDALIQQLREAITNDDITSQLLARSSEPADEIFKQELEKHTPKVKIIEQNLAAQENIINKLTSLYASYGDSRRLLSDVLRKREGLINALITSYDTYEELLGKSQKGQEFYKKLSHNVSQLLTRLRSTCQVQQEEREQLLAKHSSKASTPSPVPATVGVTKMAEVAPTPSTGTRKLKDYLPYMKNRTLAGRTQVPVDVVQPDTYYPESIYPTSVRPTPVGSEATDLSQTQLPDGVVVPQALQNPNNPYGRYGTPYAPTGNEPYSIQSNYGYPMKTGYDKPEDAQYGYNTPYTPPQYSLQDPQSQYTNPYYSATHNSSTIVTDSQSPMAYNSVSQANMHPNVSQYGVYSDPYNQHNQMATIPEVSSAYSTPYNQSQDLTANFGQMQIATPRSEPISQPTRQPMSQPMSQPMTQPMSQPVSQPMSQPMGQPISQATGYGADYSQTYYNIQYPQTSTPNVATYSNAHNPNTNMNMTPSQLPSDYNSMNYPYSTNTQYQPTPNVSSTYSAEQQYSYPNYATPEYPIYTNTDSNMTSTTSITNIPVSVPQAYSTIPEQDSNFIDPKVLAQLDAIDKPIKSHVTGEALSTTPQYQPNYQNIPNATPNYNPAEQNTVPTTSYQYPDQTQNVNCNQTYQNHPGYNYNPATGTYDYNYGSQNSFTGYVNPDQANVNSQSMGQNPNWPAQGVYTSAGTCETVQSPSSEQVPQTSVEPLSDNQTYYNAPYGYQTIQPNESVPNSQPETTNYGANINQSTYMQCGQGQDTSVTFSNNQVTTPKEEMPQPNFDNNVPETPIASSQIEIETKTEPEKPVDKPEPSVFDLLSDIDFAVEHKPLMPEIKVPQISESAIKKSSTPKPMPVVAPAPKEEVLERPAKVDLFSDPSLLNKFTQEVKNLQKLVDSLTDKTPSRLTLLDSKWKTFQDVQAKENMTRTKTIAMQHSSGNIVTDVVPFDDSRLTLKSDPDAYFNVSYYRQLASWCIPLVISKNPAEEDWEVFWRAVLEHKISCIVCLLSEIEIQGKSYWPTARGQSLDLSGGLKVTLEEVTCTVHWTERKLTVACGKTAFNVTHYQINVFPAKIVCSPLVLLADKILKQTYDGRLSNQLATAWLHCAAGAGRSSLIALLLMLMCQVRAGQLALVDMLDTGCINLYKHRSNVLEDTKYLADAYRTALFYVQGVLCSGTAMFNGEAVSVPSGASVLPPVTPTPTVATSSGQKQKFSRESFEEMKQSPGLKSGDMKDPLNFLDPLWSLKKK
ncbi:tyrosine-protein phosphatase non-receptor type 23 [Galleria mellonella]|uniref:Tyrosine-protein phosphatase non-receptor type 23 n=1 Tax=Galleria mellonella TaxID=7137 RepID=A0ABM3N538_GALME|nr:tyrosine-protein phosphatase non-receptor type 23 [Galleria mellonella]